MLVVAVAGTLLVIAAFLATSLSIQTNPQVITIWGNVDVQDSQKQPVEISFDEEYGERSFRALINDVGYYQTESPERERYYDVMVGWENSDGLTGICYAGSLYYDGNTPPPLSRDFGC